MRPTDSNVYPAIKTEPIKGNGSAARHPDGAAEGERKVINCFDAGGGLCLKAPNSSTGARSSRDANSWLRLSGFTAETGARNHHPNPNPKS